MNPHFTSTSFIRSLNTKITISAHNYLNSCTTFYTYKGIIWQYWEYTRISKKDEENFPVSYHYRIIYYSVLFYSIVSVLPMMATRGLLLQTSFHVVQSYSASPSISESRSSIYLSALKFLQWLLFLLEKL